MASPVGADPPLHETRAVLAGAGIPQDGPAVVVARQKPYTERRAAMDGRGVTEAMVVRVRIAPAGWLEEEVSDDRFGVIRHRRHPGLRDRRGRLTRFPVSSGSGRAPCSGGTLGLRRGSALP